MSGLKDIAEEARETEQSVPGPCDTPIPMRERCCSSQALSDDPSRGSVDRARRSRRYCGRLTNEKSARRDRARTARRGPASRGADLISEPVCHRPRAVGGRRGRSRDTRRLTPSARMTMGARRRTIAPPEPRFSRHPRESRRARSRSRRTRSDFPWMCASSACAFTVAESSVGCSYLERPLDETTVWLGGTD